MKKLRSGVISLFVATANNPKILALLNSNWDKILPDGLKSNRDLCVQKLKDLYFNGHDLTEETIFEYLKVFYLPFLLIIFSVTFLLFIVTWRQVLLAPYSPCDSFADEQLGEGANLGLSIQLRLSQL